MAVAANDRVHTADPPEPPCTSALGHSVRAWPLIAARRPFSPAERLSSHTQAAAAARAYMAETASQSDKHAKTNQQIMYGRQPSTMGNEQTDTQTDNRRQITYGRQLFTER